MQPAAPSACPCCQGNPLDHLGSKSSAFLAHDTHYYRCRGCAYLWVEPFPGYEIYNEAYYAGRGPDPFVDYANEYADYRRTDRAIEFADLWRIASSGLRAAPAEGTVRWLDYGCGAGGLLKFLRDQPGLPVQGRTLPLRLAGHDIGAYADRLRDVDGFTILTPEQLAPNGPFDVISCIEVAEHVREVHALFDTLAGLLRPGGILLLTTGNLTGPAARLSGLDYRYLMPELHVSLFNPGCLAHLYRQRGLEPWPVRYRGVVRFKVIKSLRHPVLKAVARAALALPGVTRAIDLFYGVSAMPCARKPVPAA